MCKNISAKNLPRRDGYIVSEIRKNCKPQANEKTNKYNMNNLKNISSEKNAKKFFLRTYLRVSNN